MCLNKKGFSLIELIVVLVIMSIIVLIAVPNFTPYKTYAEESELKQKILEVEYQVKKIIVESNLDNWEITNITDNNNLWTSKRAVKDLSSGSYIKIPNELLKTKLNGSFYLSNGLIYYSNVELNYDIESNKPAGKADIPEKSPEKTDEELGENQIPEIENSLKVSKENLLELINTANNLVEEDYSEGWKALVATYNKSLEVYYSDTQDSDKIERSMLRLQRSIDELKYKPAINWVIAKDSDFTWKTEIFYGYNVKNKILKGYYQYTGNDEYIIIPDYIEGTRLSSYRRMFQDNINTNIKGVASNNSSIVQLYNMFANSKFLELNLNKLNVSSVEEFTSMFNGADIDLLSLNEWDNSKAVYLDEMFLKAKIKNIDFGKFHINNVRYTRSMFRDLVTDVLDVSNFDLTKPSLTMTDMFRGINANKVYVKNEVHKNKIISKDVKANKDIVFIKQQVEVTK